MKDLRTIAEAWMAEDPDPETREATAAMLDDEALLKARFGARLQFGTAGLRGPIGPGPNAMNRSLVRRVSAGLGTYVAEVAPGSSIVIGFDGRKNSDVFAEDTARVLAGLGFTVLLFDHVCPTPRLAHAVVRLGASAGVMVTASHNPPADNGYKVYWSNGAQIVPPHDRGISAAIDRIGSLDEVEVPELDALRAEGRVTSVPSALDLQYLDEVLALRVHTAEPLTIVYTAMHGVGNAEVTRVMEAAGYTIHSVPEQAEPDGTFPTVAFPNPEEPGALDLATALAREVGADLVLANDPDADRLAVMVPDGDGYRQLTGNQVGCLLAEDLLHHGEPGNRLVATTIVSSTLLRKIAEAYGAVYAETLTGFKWIANEAIPFDEAGGRFVLGYEEALGYSAGDVARDKDGVSAVLLFADLASHWRAQGKTVLDAIERLYREHGVHASRQVSVKHPGAAGAAKIEAIMGRLRDGELAAIDGVPVVRRDDVLTGLSIDLAANTAGRLTLPSSNVLAWTLEDGCRVLARPSGTEPKIKFYFEAVIPFEGDLATSEASAEARLDALSEAFLATLEG